MRRARVTGRRAVLCMDRMDGELEDRRDGEEQKGGRTLHHGRAKLGHGLQRPSVCPLRGGTSSLRGLCGVSMCSGGRQPVQTVVAPVQQGREWGLGAG